MTRTQLDDDQVLAVLQGRADNALPVMALDPVAMLVGGRRHQRRRRLTVATGAATTGLALTLLTAQVIDFGAVTGHIAGTEQSSAAGDGANAAAYDVAPGVRATVRLEERHLADGTTALLLGLDAANVSASGTELALVANDEWKAQEVQAAPWLAEDLDIALLDGDSISQRQHWDGWVAVAPLTDEETEFWTRSGFPAPDMLDPRLIGGRPDRLAGGEGWAMSIATDDGTWIIVGFAPPGTDPAAEAMVTLREPLPAHDGSDLTVLRLPTFDVLSSDRRMFAATIAPGVGPAQPTPGGVPTTAVARIPVDFAAP